MHKAMHEEITRTPYALDETDRGILADRTAAWQTHEGPRVGDYLTLTDGRLVRFTPDGGETLQTTSPTFGGGSFHLSRGGEMSYSGALDPGFEKSRLVDTQETRPGRCWFSSHDFSIAHNGVDVEVPCRVYRLFLEGEQA